MEAIVLAGGRGTRLAGMVPNLPKPMAPIAGRPFLAWLLDALEQAGFDRAILSTGFRAEAIQQHFGTRFGSIELFYSHEEEPLGTGGALLQAMQHVRERHVFVLNGDTFAAVDYAGMLQAHVDRDETLTVALQSVPDTSRYGAVETSGPRITGFREKGRSGPGLINAGVYLLRRDLLPGLPLRRQFSFEQEVLMQRLNQVQPAAFRTSGYFIDIGIPEDYLRAQRELPGHLR